MSNQPEREQPIQLRWRSELQAMARRIDRKLNPGLKSGKRRWGFILAIFPFGLARDGRFNYVSNSERADIATLMREMADKFESDIAERDVQ